MNLLTSNNYFRFVCCNSHKSLAVYMPGIIQQGTYFSNVIYSKTEFGYVWISSVNVIFVCSKLNIKVMTNPPPKCFFIYLFSLCWTQSSRKTFLSSYQNDLNSSVLPPKMVVVEWTQSFLLSASTDWMLGHFSSFHDHQGKSVTVFWYFDQLKVNVTHLFQPVVLLLTIMLLVLKKKTKNKQNRSSQWILNMVSKNVDFKASHETSFLLFTGGGNMVNTVSA